jgi:hypothetical protein
MIHLTRAPGSKAGDMRHRAMLDTGSPQGAIAQRIAPTGAQIGGIRHSASQTRVNALMAIPPYALQISGFQHALRKLA